MAHKNRNWCITINNPEERDWLQAKNLHASGTLEYYVFGTEVGENGTRHIQGYLEFKNARTMSGLKKLWPKAHLEVRAGSSEEASTYCKKDGDFVEEGVQKKSRVRELISSPYEIGSLGVTILEQLLLKMYKTINNYGSLKGCLDTLETIEHDLILLLSGSGEQQVREKAVQHLNYLLTMISGYRAEICVGGRGTMVSSTSSSMTSEGISAPSMNSCEFLISFLLESKLKAVLAYWTQDT